MKILRPVSSDVTAVTNITKTIKSIRRRRGLSQASIAKAMGITTYQYKKLESGKTKLWLGKFFDICEILNIEPVELLQACADANNGRRITIERGFNFDI